MGREKIMSSVIRAQNLHKRYGKKFALNGTSFDVASGRIVGLIGPNGAGKTTALKAILGLTSVEGHIRVLDLDPFTQRNQLMNDVCFIADVAVLPRWIRVWQAVEYVESVHPKFDRPKFERFIAQTNVSMKAKVKELSKGMVTQLHLALIMSIDAKLLVLDEPTLGLDIIYRKRFYEQLLGDYFDENKTILITTHQVEEVEHLLTDLIFIQDGQIVLSDSMENVADKYFDVLVEPANIDRAKALGPLSERKMLNKMIYLFGGRTSAELNEIGEVHPVSVADLFVALMSKPMLTKEVAA
jgi:ABC-2 type transport system ATP-binding protein